MAVRHLLEVSVCLLGVCLMLCLTASLTHSLIRRPHGKGLTLQSETVNSCTTIPLTFLLFFLHFVLVSQPVVNLGFSSITEQNWLHIDSSCSIKIAALGPVADRMKQSSLPGYLI